jgi:hypothetical protein
LVKDESSGCLIFTGAKDTGGYGKISVPRDSGGWRLESTHRVVWEAAGRGYPEGKPHLLHSCDNKACCNLDHLRPGSQQDNAIDMAKRGRGRKGKLPFGVARSPSGRFSSNIVLAKVRYRLGTFDTPEEANAMALEAKQMYYDSRRMEEEAANAAQV